MSLDESYEAKYRKLQALLREAAVWLDFHHDDGCMAIIGATHPCTCSQYKLWQDGQMNRALDEAGRPNGYDQFEERFRPPPHREIMARAYGCAMGYGEHDFDHRDEVGPLTCSRCGSTWRQAMNNAGSR